MRKFLGFVLRLLAVAAPIVAIIFLFRHRREADLREHCLDTGVYGRSWSLETGWVEHTGKPTLDPACVARFQSEAHTQWFVPGVETLVILSGICLAIVLAVALYRPVINLVRWVIFGRRPASAGQDAAAEDEVVCEDENCACSDHTFACVNPHCKCPPCIKRKTEDAAGAIEPDHTPWQPPATAATGSEVIQHR